MNKITIRNYSNTDYPMIESWWLECGEIAPLPGMMPEESSFVAEIDGVPALAIALYTTNTFELAYLENFIGNPAMRGEVRQKAASELVEHTVADAKRRGYKRLMCMTEKSILTSRYSQLGFYPTLCGVTTLVRNT